MHTRFWGFTAIASVAICSSAHAAFTLKSVVEGWMGPHQANTWVAQLDGDPALELISLRGNPGSNSAVFIWDGATGVQEFQDNMDAADASGGVACLVADVDGDGLLEVLVASASANGFSRTMIIDTDAFAGAVGAPSSLPVAAQRLEQSRPNPSWSTTTIGFTIDHDEPVTLNVYNVAGQLVRTLVREGRVGTGSHEVEWDGRDDSGSRVASGTYFYRLEGRGGAAAKKAVILR